MIQFEQIPGLFSLWVSIFFFLFFPFFFFFFLDKHKEDRMQASKVIILPINALELTHMPQCAVHTFYFLYIYLYISLRGRRTGGTDRILHCSCVQPPNQPPCVFCYRF
ncbi:hypothetical protein ACKS0A_06507 [Histoplasma ohiense]